MKTILRVLFFKFTKEDCLKFTRSDFLLGLLITWIVGIGRYWDNPKANLAQHLGVGSVVYIFLLSFFVWIIVYPIRKADWKYFQVLTFIAMVSLPAILYAVPVERFMDLQAARSVNVWFLSLVALWRVVLLFLFLKRYAQLTSPETLIATLLPLTVIVSLLTALNLEHVVFNIMAGNSETSATANDSAYYFLILLTTTSIFLLPILLIGYGVLIYRTRAARTK